jgi:P-type Mg2+ transporter
MNPMNISNGKSFWACSLEDIFHKLETPSTGLTDSEARRRLSRYGFNLLKKKKRTDRLTLFFSQFKSPIILILLFAAALSIFLHNSTDALIILTIVVLSGFLGFWQEKGATEALEKLIQYIQIKAEVIRDGVQREISMEEVVPGDVVILNAGDNIPGDCLILESKDLFVNEATLTGENYPVEKSVGILPEQTPLSQRTNALFMGTHVVSGAGRAVVVSTGQDTEMGKVSQRLTLKPPETEFEHGIRHFGYLLMEVTFLLVIAIFAINVFLHRPVLESFLFSMALAVGLTPQLLPAIISVNLAHGAKAMAKEKVIVRRLASIENFGSMNILCSDKTGTLTEGVIRVRSALDMDGRESERVLFHAYLNAFFEKGFTNPLDEAIRKHRVFDLGAYERLDEEPYDFTRRRLSVLVAKGEQHLLVTKGAFSAVLEICTSVETASGKDEAIGAFREKIQKSFEDLGRQGFRVLGVAKRELPASQRITRDDEKQMTFLGFLVLYDPPKKNIGDTLSQLKNLGISLKIITGDSKEVTSQLGRAVGLVNPRMLMGSDLHRMSGMALLHLVNQVDLFAEVEPNQKEMIILALKKTGNVVGYLGDGINDISALHGADVGISVDQAVDVAKEAADIVLLEKDLEVLVDGVRAGRTTFANTLKYVFMATSANFGNMFSMAGASLFLSFLPLLPKQILLVNLMTDLPEMTIATDRVDPEMTDRPRRWDIRFIRRFMIAFGLLSSVFDYLTFGVLIFFLKAGETEFRTGWFVESVISAAMIVLVIRSPRPFFKSRPGRYLFWMTLLVAALTLLLPYLHISPLFGFQPLPLSFLIALGIVLVLYVFAAEGLKRVFFKWVKF